MYIVFLALFAHIFRPDTGLYLTDMRLAQIEHTEAGLPYTATDGKRQCIIHQAFVEVKFQAFLFALLFELAKQGFLVYADTHGGKFDAALQDVVP